MLAQNDLKIYAVKPIAAGYALHESLRLLRATGCKAQINQC